MLLLRRCWDFTSDRIIYPLLLGLGTIAICLCLFWGAYAAWMVVSTLVGRLG